MTIRPMLPTDLDILDDRPGDVGVDRLQTLHEATCQLPCRRGRFLALATASRTPNESDAATPRDMPRRL